METALFELEMLRQQPEIEDEYLEISPSARQALALLNTDDTKAAAALLFRYASTARGAYAAALKALKELQGDRFNRNSQAAVYRPVNHLTSDHRPTSEEPAPAAADRETQNDETNRKVSVVAAHRKTAVASFIVLRRRRVGSLAQITENREIPNEPEFALVAGRSAGSALAYA
jgi:hypothetical protein